VKVIIAARCRFIFEKLMFAQLIKKLSVINGTGRLIIVFTTA
jgi:hypothetical protein